MGDAAITAVGLEKRYDGDPALDGFGLHVEAGAVCALLGPNGAGKTTVVRILTTLLRPDGGQAYVAGADVVREPQEVRRRIGLSGQEAAVDEILSARQNLILFGRLNRLSRAAAASRAEALLHQMHLQDAADRAVKHFSGGMRRRLDLAVTLILAPRVLFLDEPTTGLDPANRAEVWSAIRTLVDAGTTLLLTTHYLDEADRLADQVVVIDHGREIAGGSPSELKASVGRDRVEVVADRAEHVPRLADIVAGVARTNPDASAATRTVSAPVSRPVAALSDVLLAADGAGVELADIGLRRPTLDDVFLELTGHRAGAAPAEPVDPPNEEVPA